MVICLERGADLHTAQLMPLPLTVSCFSKIQIGFTFLVPAHLGSPGQTAVKRVCVFPTMWHFSRLCRAVQYALWTGYRCSQLLNAQQWKNTDETNQLITGSQTRHSWTGGRRHHLMRWLKITLQQKINAHTRLTTCVVPAYTSLYLSSGPAAAAASRA